MLDEWISLTFASVLSFAINDAIKDSAIATSKCSENNTLLLRRAL